MDLCDMQVASVARKLTDATRKPLPQTHKFYGTPLVAATVAETNERTDGRTDSQMDVANA